jgi:hypothetical protein
VTIGAVSWNRCTSPLAGAATVEPPFRHRGGQRCPYRPHAGSNDRWRGTGRLGLRGVVGYRRSPGHMIAISVPLMPVAPTVPAATRLDGIMVSCIQAHPTPGWARRVRATALPCLAALARHDQRKPRQLRRGEFGRNNAVGQNGNATLVHLLNSAPKGSEFPVGPDGSGR